MSTSCENDKFVTLVASLKGSEPVRRQVRKDVIQCESFFVKECIQDGASETKIPLKRPKNLNLILQYLYEGQLIVSKEKHLESLWNDARILGLLNLEQVCVQRLTDTISFYSWVERLEFAQAEACHELESKVLSFVNANFAKCCSSSSFTLLSVHQMVQVLQLPTVQTAVTESNRILVILDWVKANELDRCSQAHLLLEQVDLTKLTEDSLRSFFDEEPALWKWRCVAIFQRAIRLKKTEETARHSGAVQGHEMELIQAGPAAFESIDNRLINIKQEVASDKSCDAQVYALKEIMKFEESVRARGILMKQKVSPPLPSSVGETRDTVENNENDPPPPKMPRLENSQNEAESDIQGPPRQTDFVSKQKQILYLSQLSNGATSLNFVIISAGSISQPQQALASLPEYIHKGIPKLFWLQEPAILCFLGDFGSHSEKVPLLNYMTGKGVRAPKVTLLSKLMPDTRHHHSQPVLIKRCLYVFGGSKAVISKKNDRRSFAEDFDVTTAPRSRWQWQPFISPEMKRDRSAAVYVNGNIYVTGGAIEKPMKKEPSITKDALC